MPPLALWTIGQPDNAIKAFGGDSKVLLLVLGKRYSLSLMTYSENSCGTCDSLNTDLASS